MPSNPRESRRGGVCGGPVPGNHAMICGDSFPFVGSGAMTEGRVLRMDGAVLVFGGPYSNLEATLAVLAEARRRAIPRERIICTGDIVAYAADGVATTVAVREAGVRAVMGNCEESLAAGA